MTKGLFRFRVLVGVLIGWAMLFGLWRIVQSPREAERRLAHLRYVLAVVAQYVREHQGAWPGSWEEIEKVKPSSLPSDIPARQAPWPEVRAEVKIDFRADPRKLLQAGPEQFDAITPRGRCGDYRADVERLLQAIRESLPSDTASAKKASASGTSSSGRPSSPAEKAPPAEAQTKLPPGKPSSSSLEQSPSEKPSDEKMLPGLADQVSEKAAKGPKPTESLKSPEKPSPTEEPKSASEKKPSQIILPGLPGLE